LKKINNLYYLCGKEILNVEKDEYFEKDDTTKIAVFPNGIGRQAVHE